MLITEGKMHLGLTVANSLIVNEQGVEIDFRTQPALVLNTYSWDPELEYTCTRATFVSLKEFIDYFQIERFAEVLTISKEDMAELLKAGIAKQFKIYPFV